MDKSTVGSSSLQASSILLRLSLKEKVALLSGDTTWRTKSIPSLDIPSLKCTDGPNGARGESIHNSTKAVCFPCGTCLGATWDRDLVKAVGIEIAREAKTKRAHILLGPTMNIHRAPLHGRNFESFSEDPTLTGHLAAAYVNGVQSEGVAATPKHFICNEVEQNRTSVDTVVSSGTLREIYLKAFQVMLQNCDPMCMMTSYNKLNGEWCSQDVDLLQSIVRNEWGYKGMIMSDWYGTYSEVLPVKAGMNLEMPGPSKHRGEKTLLAVADGLIAEAEIDRCALPLLDLAIKLRGLRLDGDEICDITPERLATARKAASEGIVLLKNHNSILPLRPETLKRIAVIGAFGTEPTPHGGGSASLRSPKVVTPFEALQQALPDTEVSASYGVSVFKKLPSPPISSITIEQSQSSAHGVRLQWFDGRQFLPEKIILTEIIEQLSLILIDPRVAGLKPDHCVRLSTYLRPTCSGDQIFSITSSGPSILYINDEEFNTFEGMNKINEDFIWQPSKYEKRKSYYMEAGKVYKVVLEAQGTSAAVPPGMVICPQGCGVGYFEQALLKSGIEDAAVLAEKSDIAIVFVGNTAEYESEGFDRESMSLSKGQDELVRAVVKAQPKTIV